MPALVSHRMPVCIGYYERAVWSVRAEEAVPSLGVIMGVEDPVGWYPRDTEVIQMANNPIARLFRGIHRMLNRCWRGVSSYHVSYLGTTFHTNELCHAMYTSVQIF